MILRPYQERAVQRVIELLPRNPVLQIPTGGGKTLCAEAVIERLDHKVVFVAHRREIIEQTCQRFLLDGLDAGILMAGHPYTPGSQVQVASIQTLARREMPPGVGLVIVDEAHHVKKDGAYSKLAALGLPMLGLTATPGRLDGAPLRDFGFGELVVGATYPELIRDGYIHEPAVFVPSHPDLRGVRTLGGDFRSDDTSKVMRKPAIVGNVVDTWFKRGAGKRTVLFAVDVEHSLTMRDRFRAAGVRAEHIDAFTPRGERADILAALRAGVIDVVANCEVISEGLDLPALEVAAICRPTKSLVLHIQCIGRILRACAGKTGAVVLDHANNTGRHGLVTDPIAWSLDGHPDKGEVTTKECPSCGRVTERGVNPCPTCGYVWSGRGKPLERNKREGDGELVLLERQLHFGDVVQAPIEVPKPEAPNRHKVWAKARAIAKNKNPDDTKRASTLARILYNREIGEWPYEVSGRLIEPATATERDVEALRREWEIVARDRRLDNEARHLFVAKQEAGFRARMRQQEVV